MFEPLLLALPAAFEWTSLLAIVGGLIGGIVIGALPGLSATMGMSVLIPFTFGLDPLVALGMMAGIYNGAMYGGAIPAVLLRIPGTPAAVATTFDGYPMAQAGRGGEALQVAVVSSGLGAIGSAVALILLAPPLARVTLLFGPAEIFWVAVFGLSSIAFLLGDNPVKGMLSACFGVMAAMVGTDVLTANDRYTFDALAVVDGIDIVVLLVGVYALPPAIDLLEEADLKVVEMKGRLVTGNIFRAMWGMRRFCKTWMRAIGLGIFIGILPGAGGAFAAFISYNEARRASKDPSKWGKGEPEGIAAAETCNNADTAAAMIPALTLGIPGTSVAAVVLGGLLIHGLQPGPMLFREHPVEVFGFMIQFLLAGVLLIFVGGALATNAFAQVLRLPRPLLGGLILVLMVVGVYSINERMFDVYLMFCFGIVGYGMERLDFPLAPVVLGLILGSFAELNFRIALQLNRGAPDIFWASPTAKIVIVLTLAVMLWPAVRGLLGKRKQAEETTKR